MKLKILLKFTKAQGYILSLINTILEKPQGDVKMIPPCFFSVKITVQ